MKLSTIQSADPTLKYDVYRVIRHFIQQSFKYYQEKVATWREKKEKKRKEKKKEVRYVLLWKRKEKKPGWFIFL